MQEAEPGLSLQTFEETFDALNELLVEQGRSLAAMESCTGGLFAHTITNQPGCGDYFLGSIVSYATQAKVAQGVDQSVIEKFGVISAQTAEAMATVARKQFGADYALGITGVAGPKTQEGRAVGTVYVGVAAEDVVQSRRFELGDNGLDENKRLAAQAAARMVMELVQGQAAAG